MQDNPNYSYISTVILDDDTVHYIKDIEARDAITGLETYVDERIDGLGAYLNLVGTKASEVEIKEITSAKKGDVYINTANNSEWVCVRDIITADADAWEELGTIVDLSGYVKETDLGELAKKDSASGSVKVTGSISIDNYKPEGVVTAPNINLTPIKSDIYSVKEVGTLPSHGEDTFVKPTFTSGDFNAGTLPTWSASVTNKTLKFSFNQGTLPTHGADNFTQGSFSPGEFNAGTLPTIGEAQSVISGIKSITSTQPAFIGTPKAPTGSFNGDLINVVVS